MLVHMGNQAILRQTVSKIGRAAISNTRLSLFRKSPAIPGRNMAGSCHSSTTAKLRSETCPTSVIHKFIVPAAMIALCAGFITIRHTHIVIQLDSMESYNKQQPKSKDTPSEKTVSQSWINLGQEI